METILEPLNKVAENNSDTVADTVVEKPAKSELFEKLGVEFDAQVAGAVEKRAEIEAKIQAVNEQYQSRQAQKDTVEKKLADLEKNQRDTLAMGKDTAAIRSEIDAAYNERNSFDAELEIIESDILPKLQQDLSRCQSEIDSAAKIALSKLQPVPVAVMQGNLDNMVAVSKQWQAFCSKVAKTYKMAGMPFRTTNLYQELSMPDDGERKLLHKRTEFKRPAMMQGAVSLPASALDGLQKRET